MENNQTENQPQFVIQRIYVKDLSFETPNAPAIFKAEWQPEMSIDLNTQANPIDNDIYEVELRLTVTAKLQDKVAYVAEVKQAGIFTLSGFVDDQLRAMLGSFCPNILFPYVREVIADVINRGSFPQFNLAPVNFDALYMDHLQQQQTQTAQNTENEASGTVTH
ncbi:MAG: secB [Gammaproteobacteria bacterium]|jgi:preprotein translocase subunit SecB|nr:secB [Gammaproteobacteria bacterium]